MSDSESSLDYGGQVRETKPRSTFPYCLLSCLPYLQQQSHPATNVAWPDDSRDKSIAAYFSLGGPVQVPARNGTHPFIHPSIATQLRIHQPFLAASRSSSSRHVQNVRGRAAGSSVHGRRKRPWRGGAEFCGTRGCGRRRRKSSEGDAEAERVDSRRLHHRSPSLCTFKFEAYACF
jgi:hypothetical protein